MKCKLTQTKAHPTRKQQLGLCYRRERRPCCPVDSAGWLLPPVPRWWPACAARSWACSGGGQNISVSGCAVLLLHSDAKTFMVRLSHTNMHFTSSAKIQQKRNIGPAGAPSAPQFRAASPPGLACHASCEHPSNAEKRGIRPGSMCMHALRHGMRQQASPCKQPAIS